MGCFISSCCCSAYTREKKPWINECPLLSSSVKKQWAKDDNSYKEAKEEIRKAYEWPNSFEGRKYQEEHRERELQRHNELMASRGPEWQIQQSEDMRHRQLLCAIYNLGTRI